MKKYYAPAIYDMGLEIKKCDMEVYIATEADTEFIHRLIEKEEANNILWETITKIDELLTKMTKLTGKCIDKLLAK